MKKILYKIILTFTVFFISLYSCTKETIDLKPVGSLTLVGAFSDGNNTTLTLNGVYNSLAELAAGTQNFMTAIEIKSDDAFDAYDRTAIFKLDTETPNNIIILSTWSSLYTTIQRANLVISKINTVPFTTDELTAGLKESIEGQALFLRALSYYWLVNFWGGVPLITEYSENPEASQIAQSSISDVYAQIKKDLNDAAGLLLPKSSMNGSNGFERGRATKGAAYALLAEVDLNLAEWQEAVDATNMVINSTEYNLRTGADYQKNFRGLDENGLESIFEIQYGTSLNGPTSGLSECYAVMQAPGLIGQAFFGSPCTNDIMDLPGYKGTSGNGLMQEWENGDIRKDIALTTFGVPNSIDPAKQPLWLPYKYFTDQPNSNGSSWINYVVLRYTRTLLTKAEALNELTGGNPEAVTIINSMRSRAGLDPLPVNVSSDQNLFREAIWKERRLELCYEGSRYIDLLRTGRYIPILEGIQGISVPRSRLIQNPFTQMDWYLWPIPQTELNINPKLKQNPGY